jgi:hypothetical protein
MRLATFGVGSACLLYALIILERTDRLVLPPWLQPLGDASLLDLPVALSSATGGGRSGPWDAGRRLAYSVSACFHTAISKRRCWGFPGDLCGEEARYVQTIQRRMTPARPRDPGSMPKIARPDAYDLLIKSCSHLSNRLGALAIVFASFFTTLKVLDYFGWPTQETTGGPAQHVAALPHILQDGSIDITTMKSEVGKIAGGAAVARAPADKAGALLFGPYVHLSPGSYGLYIRFTCADNQTANVLEVQARWGQQKLANTQLEPHDPRCDGGPHEVELPFKLTSATEQAEFKVIFGGTGTIEISRLRLLVD